MILLDTHAVIWLLLAPEQLSERAHNAILEARSAGERIAYSPISLYEIANAARRRRLHMKSTIQELVAAIQVRLELDPLTPEIAICAAELPRPFHGDPMDRIIVATAIVEGSTLITQDDRVRRAGLCKVLW